MTTQNDIKCTGTMRAVSMEPALAAFFGVSSEDLSSMEVDVEFIVHNTWQYDYPGSCQRLTLTKINGIEIDYDVNVTSQDGRIDLWGTVDTNLAVVNVMLGVDMFQIRLPEYITGDDSKLNGEITKINLLETEELDDAIIAATEPGEMNLVAQSKDLLSD